MEEDGPPQLEDFESELKDMNPKNKTSTTTQDYTVPNIRHIEDETQKLKRMQHVNQQSNTIQQALQQVKPEEPKKAYGGMKKGFFSSGPPASKEKAVEVKVPQKSRNPLEIKEVQDAMKVNDYLTDTRSQWMNNDFLQQVQTNPKIAKLFSTPEYMQAVDMFQKDSQKAMLKYGHNKELMECFQEFCKLMGTQFTKLAQETKKQTK